MRVVPDQASCPEEGAVALESAAAAIEATLAWRQRRRFLAPQQLTCWDHLVRAYTGRRNGKGKGKERKHHSH
jgi:hypothetical protein